MVAYGTYETRFLLSLRLWSCVLYVALGRILPILHDETRILIDGWLSLRRRHAMLKTNAARVMDDLRIKYEVARVRGDLPICCGSGGDKDRPASEQVFKTSQCRGPT